jgi:hypothetical protein
MTTTFDVERGHNHLERSIPLLVVIRADEHTRHPSLDGLIPLTCNEIRRLFTMLVVQPVHDVAHWLAWSAWRRRHQARAQASHYRRQAANQT